MSNKTQLQTNNTNLDALITRVNAAKDTAASLPEAGGGGGDIETYTLVIESDGVAKLSWISYVSYIDGQFQYHDDSVNYTSYPVSIPNVVLNTPLSFTITGGFSAIRLISNVNYVKATDYIANVEHPFGDSWYFLPIETDNGKIVVECYDDD